ncbi:MAG: hypothetical protein HOP03_00060 [Lysobacter sp.]|nr:hypothetical protein [Lysobacter sp.]
MELPSDVKTFIEGNFPLDQREEALSILSQARIEDGTVPNPRLVRCAAFASHGSLLQLKQLAALLAVDWRDVIVAGEYELHDEVLVRIRDLSLPLQV